MVHFQAIHCGWAKLMPRSTEVLILQKNLVQCSGEMSTFSTEPWSLSGLFSSSSSVLLLSIKILIGIIHFSTIITHKSHLCSTSAISFRKKHHKLSFTFTVQHVSWAQRLKNFDFLKHSDYDTLLSDAILFIGVHSFDRWSH